MNHHYIVVSIEFSAHMHGFARFVLILVDIVPVTAMVSDSPALTKAGDGKYITRGELQ